MVLKYFRTVALFFLFTFLHLFIRAPK